MYQAPVLDCSTCANANETDNNTNNIDSLYFIYDYFNFNFKSNTIN